MSTYTDAVELYTAGLQDVSPGAAACCPECNPDNLTQDELYECDEPWFSWSACETCGSSLGGDREAGHAFTKDDGELVHLSMCTDCVMYSANGDEPETWRAHARDDDHKPDD